MTSFLEFWAVSAEADAAWAYLLAQAAWAFAAGVVVGLISRIVREV